MTLKVIEGGKKAATVEQIAAMEFGAVGRMARMPKAKRLKELGRHSNERSRVFAGCE